MSTDVEFRLTLTRDPQARAALRQWEADLLASIARVEQARLRAGAGSIQSLHNMQMTLMRQQQTTMAAAQQANQRALQQSLSAQAAMWRAHAAQIAALMRQANTTGLPPGGGGGGAGGGAAGGMSGLDAVRGLAGGYLGYQGVRAAGNFATNAVQAYGNIESQQIQLGVLTGSKGSARELMSQLKEVQQAMGVSITSLATASKMMIGFGVDAQDSADKLKRFSAITGGNEDAVYRLGRAYGQVKGLGKLMSEETNQMIDAGFSPLIAISKRTGESIGEVRQRMRDGGVMFDEVRQSIEAMTEAGGMFAGTMTAMKESTNATIGRMSAAWLEFKQVVGGELAPLAKSSEAPTTNALGGSGGMLQFVSGAYLGGDNLQAGYEKLSRGKAKGNASEVGATATGGLLGGVSGLTLGLLGNKKEGARSLKLQSEQEARAKNVVEIEKKAKDQRAAALAAEKKAYDLRGVSQAKEIAEAQKLNDLRLKSAKDELKARKEILEDAKKATAEAGKALMTAQERFGAMTTEEQGAAVNELLNARRNGVANLSLEQINRIKSIGTKEAEHISGAALRNRAGAAFGLTNPEDSIAGRQASIQQEIARLQNSNAGRMGVSFKARRDNDARINQLRQEASQFEGVAERSRGQYQEQMGVRSSIFTQERRDLQLAERKQLAVEANVQQSIQFVAKFDQTAQQIATQVMEMFTVASNEQMKEVLKIINPIKKQVDAANLRRQATAQQG